MQSHGQLVSLQVASMASLYPSNSRRASLTQHQFRSYHCRTWVLHLLSVQQQIRKTKGRLHCHAVQAEALPVWMPPQINEIEDPAALAMAARMQRTTIQVPAIGAVDTVFVGPDSSKARGSGTPVLLLHSFDSSSLEFRQLMPLLEQAEVPTWAVDLIGWGFTDSGAAWRPDMQLGPQQKREHLFSFWQAKIGQPMVVLGTSVGGAVAIDFALDHPEAVAKLCLVDAQGFIDGLGPMAKAPGFLTKFLVGKVLKAEWLRQSAASAAYFDKKRFATKDAMRIGRLHTFCPGWTEANQAFIRSGGYSLSKSIHEVQQECLVCWGRQDEVLDPKYAKQFSKELPRSKLVWMEECGHSGHLEQPQMLADYVLDFLQVPRAAQVASRVPAPQT